MAPDTTDRLRSTTGPLPAPAADAASAIKDLAASAWDAGYLAGSTRQIDAAHGLPVADPTGAQNPFRTADTSPLSPAGAVHRGSSEPVPTTSSGNGSAMGAATRRDEGSAAQEHGSERRGAPPRRRGVA